MAKAFVKLTRPEMRKLQPGVQIAENGITFERRRNGDGVFTINVMVDGQRIHRVVGRESEGTTRTQAEQFIEQLRQQAREGRLNLPRGRKLHVGFRDAARNYLTRLETEGGRDLAMKRRRLNLHLVPFFGETPLSRITNFDVERYKKLRLSESAVRGGLRKSSIVGQQEIASPTKPGTVNRELAALSHLLNMAVEWGWIDKNPVKLKRLKEEGGRITYLTVDQAAALIEAAKHDQNAQIYPFIVIGLETGMRRMEILSIQREHIDLDRLVIYVPNAKAGPREQPITKHLAEFLAGYLTALPKAQEWLFPSFSSRTGHTTDVRKAFRRVVVAAKMNPDEVVRHTLRHTAITHLVQAGVDLSTIKRISGHKTLLMVERYAHANNEHIRAAMDKLEGRYRKAG